MRKKIQINKKTLKKGAVVLAAFIIVIAGKAASFYTDGKEVGEKTGKIINEIRVPDNNTETDNNEELFKVIKVVDGDTIDVLIDGVTKRIRVIGINTPETVDPRRPVQCFGIEASNRAKEALLNERVRLEADESQGDKDKYGRLLRYVILENGTDFGLWMIEDGYAHEYTYNIPHRHKEIYEEVERKARESEVGLWGDACKQ